MADHSTTSRLTVTFGDIHIREFPIEISDNPAVSAGVPIGLGWECIKQSRHQLLEYDNFIKRSRPESRCPKLDAQVRAQLLLKSGYSVPEIVDAVVEVIEIQKHRASSAKDRKWEMGSFYKGLVDSVAKVGKSPGYHIKLLLAYQARLTRTASMKLEKPRRSLSIDSDDFLKILKPKRSKSIDSDDFMRVKPQRTNSLDIDDLTISEDSPTLWTRRKEDTSSKPKIKIARSA